MHLISLCTCKYQTETERIVLEALVTLVASSIILHVYTLYNVHVLNIHVHVHVCTLYMPLRVENLHVHVYMYTYNVHVHMYMYMYIIPNTL